jgi:hypothetical protein
MSAAGLPDHEALLVALVLAPATFSRNRFFDLYMEPSMRRVRRRASHVRSIVRQLVSTNAADESGPRPFEIQVLPDGTTEISYYVQSLGLRRTTRLEPMEASLVRFVLAKVQASSTGEGTGLSEDDPDRLAIEAALRRLAPLARHSEGMYPSSARDPIA